MQLCLWTKASQKTMPAFSISVSGSTVNGWMWSLMTTYQPGLANWSLCTQTTLGGFQLVDLIMMELKDYMTCSEFECSH